MAGNFKIDISREFDRWEDGFRDMQQGDMGEEMVRQWHEVTDVMFDRTQQYVHVLTGELKSSGEMKPTRREGDTVIGEIVYDAPYAAYENARGGDHAFMDLGFQATEDQFKRALSDAFAKIVARWK